MKLITNSKPETYRPRSNSFCLPWTAGRGSGSMIDRGRGSSRLVYPVVHPVLQASDRFGVFNETYMDYLLITRSWDTVGPSLCLSHPLS